MDTPQESEDTGESRAGGFGLGLLVGAVVGAAVALLLAPASGREARRAIRRRLADARDAVGDQVEELDDRVRREIRRHRR